MQHTNRPLLALALAALFGAAPALVPSSAAAQGKGHGHRHEKGKSKEAKELARADGIRRDRDDDRDDDDRDEGDQPRGRARSVGARTVPPGQMPPAGMCRIWIDGVPPGRQPAPTDCATAERNRPSNARVLYGAQSGGSVSRRPLGSRTIVRQAASCPDVNGDGRHERVSTVVDGRVVSMVCR